MCARSCPDAETIAAYLDDELVAEQRERLEEHIAACEDCWTAMSNAVDFIGTREEGNHGRLSA